jgi:leucyl aminopeptidase
VGLGDASALTIDGVRSGAATAARAARRFAHVATSIGNGPAALDPKAVGQAMAEGVTLGTYKFTKLKKPGEVDRLSTFTVAGGAKARVQAGLDRGARVAEAVVWARDRVNEPAGHLNPTDLAAAATALAKGNEKLKVTVWDEKQIEKERLGSFRGVSLGSSEPPRLIRLAYEPAGAKKTLIFVGKGITFDSGGLSLKTGDGMMTMKTDMAGGAAVLAAVAACADLGVKQRVIAIVPATENLPGPAAIKPGDVLTARNGTTIEVLNTDAEGRLVLADGLVLATEENPAAIVDVATLTGAQVVSLGKRIGALMGNHAELMDKVKRAAATAGEPMWELPLTPRSRT